MTQYTREQIQRMPVGREMDVLVEQYVFGKKIRWMQDEWSDPVPVSGDHGYIIDKYSNDLLAAWEVAEKFPSFQVTKMHDVELPWAKEEMYRAIVKGNKYVAHAKTAPLAICRAALLAVMGI